MITNVVRNSTGKRRIFIDVRHNPERVNLNTDTPGDAVLVKIVMVTIDPSHYAVALAPYIQLDFGDAAHRESNQVYGGVSTCYQVPLDGVKAKTPMRFRGDHIPQFFMLSIYEPGEPAYLYDLGPNGCQIWLEYEFIAG
jgi:hypothetical protein